LTKTLIRSPQNYRFNGTNLGESPERAASTWALITAEDHGSGPLFRRNVAEKAALIIVLAVHVASSSNKVDHYTTQLKRTFAAS